MTNKELMVGSWVMFNDSYYQIAEISQKGWVHLSIEGSIVTMSNDYALEYLQPIPITPEILEKNGFHKEEGRVHFCDYDEYREIEIHEYSDSIWYIRKDCIEFSMPPSTCFVCYVHELQSFLRLCAFDREIEL